jgi:UDP-N-acetylmuramoyl-L-alanyl-D-glutamate--2,6-diaminopimelate ligase
LLKYGCGVHADFRALDIRFDFKGTEFRLDAKGRSYLVRLPLIGRFNVYNALAAIAAGSAMGINTRESIASLASSPQVPGRLESVTDRQGFRVFVDYAHTPDALENALETILELKPRRLITVFGCGGNRDVPKRAQMGKVADRLSDFSVVTSDNPRSEDPMAIIDGIISGISSGRYKVEADRRAAIAAALGLAQKGDIVLIAGKGHEGKQTFADRTIEFDDRVVARHCLNDLAKEGGHS